MLRIFRGERRARSAAQPAQREQGPSPEAEPHDTVAAPQSPPEGADPAEPGFVDRGHMRRRARFLRIARELAYRDLGGLVFDLHRFGQRNDEVVKAKLDTLGRIDSELRALEHALRERKPVSVLREAGVAACPRCAAIHGSGDRFCPACGLAVDQAERPVAGPSMPAPAATQASPSAHATAPAATQAPPPPSPAGPAPAPTHAPASSPPPVPTTALPAAPSAPAIEQAPAATPEADTPTEVIAAGRPGERTVAFDPLSPLQAAPHREAGRQERERS